MKFPNIGVRELLKSLIQNNTGHSSKTAAYLLGVTTGCLCVLLITLYLGYDILRDGRIDTDMVALAALIASYAAFSVGVAYPKVRGERYENRCRNKRDRPENTDINTNISDNGNK